jgi:transketolase
VTDVCKDIRKLVIEAAYTAKHGHIPSALSIVEIMQSYHNVETQDDVMILSKGHGCLALYSLLVIQGHVDEKELLTFGKKGSKLGGHPDRNKVDKIYASTGSLGHGFPIAVGTAMARKIMKKNGKVFCVIGDGEINEGSIWESILVAVNNKLDNLICVVDYNKSQVRSLEPKLTTQMFESFGCDVFEVDGHDVKALIEVMKSNDSEKPRVILANTIKGKGIKEIENDMFAWHHRAPNEEEYKRFCDEIYES